MENNNITLEVINLYTIEFIPECDVMKKLKVSAFTMKKWYSMGLKKYKIDDKKFVRVKEINDFLTRNCEIQPEVQHVNPALL